MFTKTLFLVSAVSASLLGFQAATTTFDMKDPKGVSGASITIDSLLEPVQGHIYGVGGNLQFNTSDPRKSTGTITMDIRTLIIGSKAMSEKALEDWCLDAAKYPTSSFTLTRVDRATKGTDGKWTFRATGNFQIKDKTRPLTVEGTVTHLKDSIQKRGGMPGKTGDLLVIRTTFSFNRSDFGIAPDLNKDVIGDKITINLSTVGYAPK